MTSLTLPYDQILDQSKFKDLLCRQQEKMCLKNWGKGENAVCQYLLIFLQGFQKASFSGSFNCLLKSFHDGYVRKQSVAWEEQYEEHWLKELQKSMDMCTKCCNITEIMLKTELNTTQSSNNFFFFMFCKFGNDTTSGWI